MIPLIISPLSKVKMQILAFFIVLLTCSNAEAQIYIAPNGNDNNPGTKEAPLATLTGARNALRKIKNKSSSHKSIVIHIADGNYFMEAPLVLSSLDGGSKEYPVIYKADKRANPVFSGGKIITGFKVNKNGIWEVKIPDIKGEKWKFDQLYINDQRATLARTPNKGFFKIKDIKENILIKGTGRAPEKATQTISFDNDSFQFTNQISDKEIKNIRFRTYHHWDFTLRLLDSIDFESKTVYTSGQGMKPWNPIKKGGRIVFENYKAALDIQGEWFLDDESTLFYIPLPGQTPENTTIIAPVLENMVSFNGNAKTGDYVEYIQFEGVAFKHCSYKIPTTGSEPNQAAVLVDAAIMLKGSKNIAFRNCEISKTGQHAIWFKKGCSNSVVENCYLHDLGGGGIYLGDTKPHQGVNHTKNIQIKNNIIHTGGREFPSAIGVWVGHSSDNLITYNDIGDFYYTGISVGWIWGYKPSLSKRNIITYNNIHHIGWDLLSDMAAVYTLGKSEGTIISNNVIHHVHAYSYGGWGLYTDEGSTGIIMENNLVYSTKTGGFHQHYGENNTIKNNILAFAKQFQVQCTRVEDHRSFNFTNNIIFFEEGVVLKGPWNKIDIKMDQNLYWNLSGNEYDFNKRSFVKWQKSGHDVHSYIANPGFKNPKSFNFKLKNKKQVKKIGFKPFDYKKAGVTGSKKWKEKAKLPVYITNEFDRVVNINMKNSNK